MSFVFFSFQFVATGFFLVNNTHEVEHDQRRTIGEVIDAIACSTVIWLFKQYMYITTSTE